MRSIQPYLALASCLAVTLMVTGCPSDANTTAISRGAPQSAGGSNDPFAGLSSGTGSLKQAAGMAGDAHGAGLTTVAPLTQQGAYRTASLGAVTQEQDGPYVSIFTVASESAVPDLSAGTRFTERLATYVTQDDRQVTVESGNDDRKATVTYGTASCSVSVSDVRQVVSSTRRAAGFYVTGGIQTLSATEDSRVFVDYRENTAGATSSLYVVTDDAYQPDPSLASDTLLTQIAKRGAQTSGLVAIRGTLPDGKPIDFTRGWSASNGWTFRYFHGTVALGNDQGTLSLTSQLAMSYGTDRVFPQVASGSVVIQRQDAAGKPVADITVTSFDVNATLKTAHTVGVLHDASNHVIGTFDGTIDKRSGTWQGSYQLTGQVSKPFDMSGVLEHML